MTDTPNGYRALPWYSDGYRVYDADGIEVANTFTPELALGSAKAVAKDIAEAANAHYVGKDVRIAELERAVQDYRDYYVHQYLYDDLEKLKDAAELRAEAAEDSLKRAEARLNLFLRYHNEDQEEISALGKRAKKAEADLSYYKTASKNFEDSYWEADKRAEEAEARVRELERDYYLKARSVGFGWQVKADPDIFTAPDGRVFHVGQRVKGVLSGLFSTIVGINGNGLITKYNSGIANTGVPAENLRRVWDNWDDPDIPTGTVLRDANGNSWFVGELGLLLWTGHKFTWSSEEPVAPLVEALPEDDE